MEKRERLPQCEGSQWLMEKRERDYRSVRVVSGLWRKRERGYRSVRVVSGLWRKRERGYRSVRVVSGLWRSERERIPQCGENQYRRPCLCDCSSAHTSYLNSALTTVAAGYMPDLRTFNVSGRHGVRLSKVEKNGPHI
ncbi:hypothetical protein J6590_042276 [Homalodisca vitripennis]|nr:hypothetical protein J6590_042276 [Homalodisca vitripennis]